MRYRKSRMILLKFSSRRQFTINDNNLLLIHSNCFLKNIEALTLLRQYIPKIPVLGQDSDSRLGLFPQSSGFSAFTSAYCAPNGNHLKYQ